MKLGVLIPDVPFLRIAGDIAHPDTFDFPLITEKIKAVVDVRQMVSAQHDVAIVNAYAEGSERLIAEGATFVATSCGFLAPLQNKISLRINRPFISSSLLQLRLVYAIVQRPILVLTADSDVLGEGHLRVVGADHIPHCIVGLQDIPAFANPIFSGSGMLNVKDVGEAIEEKLNSALVENPDIGAVVLECHNLGTWRERSAKATGLPVFDIVTLVNMVAAGLTGQLR